MVNFLQKRLQVFVSSTYIDLIEERQAAVEAILGAGHIPAGMELFTAGDESQMEVIKQWIDQSDVYLLILGGRYGSIEPKTGRSYTHLEYEYALKLGMPLFCCVLNDAEKRAKEKDNFSNFFELDNQPKFQEFTKIVKNGRVVTFWEDIKDIKLEVTKTLQDFSRRDNIIGWVRGNQQVNLASVTEEMTRLSKENAELREKLNNQASVTYAGLTYDELKNLLLNIEITDEDIETLKNKKWRQKGLILPEVKDKFWINQNNRNLFVFSGYICDFFSNSDFSKYVAKNMTAIQQLETLGLVSFTQKTEGYNVFNHYHLTQDGRTFFNKMKSLNEINIEVE